MDETSYPHFRELADLLSRVPRALSLKVSLSVLVPKPGTPLADAPFPVSKDVMRKLRLLRRLLGHVGISQPSVREAAFEYEIDHGDEETLARLLAALDA